MKILVINGPNLNMLGIREKEIYGSFTLDDVNNKLIMKADELEISLEFFQSNSQGALIDRIHECYGKIDGIIINPGAYGHYSIAISDAIKAVNIPTCEVHITNVFKREEARKNLVIAPSCLGVISGFSDYSYILALEGLYHVISDK